MARNNNYKNNKCNSRIAVGGGVILNMDEIKSVSKSLDYSDHILVTYNNGETERIYCYDIPELINSIKSQ